MGAPYNHISDCLHNIKELQGKDESRGEDTNQQVPASPSSHNHPHRNAHSSTPKHGSHHRRHCAEEPSVRRTIDDHKCDQRAQRTRHGPQNEHAQRTHQKSYEESVHRPNRVGQETARQPPHCGREVEPRNQARARAWAEPQAVRIQRQEEGRYEEGEGPDRAGQE